MAKKTTNFEIPYPELTDVANIPADMEDMAETIDNTFGNLATLSYEVIGEIEEE